MYTFLEKMSERFELILFSNASKVYTDEVVSQIEQDSPGQTKYFSYVLSKDHCSFDESNCEIKNLAFFCNEASGRDIKDCLIIDNNIYCFQKHLTNGLIVPKFEGSSDDHWLSLLQSYILEKFDDSCEDVRTMIAEDFNFKQIINSTRTSQIRAMMSKHATSQELNNHEEEVKTTEITIDDFEDEILNDQL
jgi:TFIIF-interacting CTD phosphatase-like protein